MVTLDMTSTHTSTNGGDTYTYNIAGLGSISITGYTCGAVTTCISVPTAVNSMTALAIDTTASGNAANGVGLLNDPINQGGKTEYEIPRSEFIQVDFSHFTGAIQSVKFNFVDVIDGWDIYKSTTAKEFATTTTPVAQGGDGLQGMFNIGTTTFASPFTSGSSTVTLTSNSTFLSVSALQADCETTIASLNIYYTPEPGTCLLMGFALVGLGVAGRKMKRRS